VYLLKGYNVILKEINDKLVLAGVERIVNDLQRIAKARRLPVFMVEGLMRNLTAQSTYDNFDKVDLVVEAVLENLKLKQEIFVQLEKICPKHAILSTNTSTIDIDEIGKFTKCQDRIIGLHYLSDAAPGTTRADRVCALIVRVDGTHRARSGWCCCMLFVARRLTSCRSSRSFARSRRVTTRSLSPYR
jgi:hypothetical protein